MGGADIYLPRRRDDRHGVALTGHERSALPSPRRLDSGHPASPHITLVRVVSAQEGAGADPWVTDPEAREAG